MLELLAQTDPVAVHGVNWEAIIGAIVELVKLIGAVVAGVASIIAMIRAGRVATKVETIDTKVDNNQKASVDRNVVVLAHIEEVKHIANSLSDKRTDEAKTSGIETGKLMERDRSDLALQNQAVGAAASLTANPPATVAAPTPVQVVNPPSDPVPTTAVKKV